jgi:hypothetical protein
MLFAYEEGAAYRLIETGYYTQTQQNTEGVPKVTPHCAVTLGLPLLTMIEEQSPVMIEVGNCYTDDSILSLACAHLLWGDYTEGTALVEKLRNPTTVWYPYTATDGYGFFANASGVNPTSPEEFDIAPLEFDNHRFGIDHLSWFSTTTATRIIQTAPAHHLKRIAALSEYHDVRWASPTEHLAESYLRNEQLRERKRVDYREAAQALRLASRKFFLSYMSHAKGVRKSLGAVREDSPDHLFNSGLRKMNAPNIVKELGPWIGRPLRLEDLPRISAETLVQLLWKLPWCLVEPLATEHYDQVVVRFTRLLDKPEYLEKLRECLIDHPKRQILGKPYDLPDNWEDTFRPLIEQHQSACDFRNEVLDADLTHDHLLFMLLLPEEKHLRSVAKSLPVWPLMREYVDQIPKHLVPRTAKY